MLVEHVEAVEVPAYKLVLKCMYSPGLDHDDGFQPMNPGCLGLLLRAWVVAERWMVRVLGRSAGVGGREDEG